MTITTMRSTQIGSHTEIAHEGLYVINWLIPTIRDGGAVCNYFNDLFVLVRGILYEEEGISSVVFDSGIIFTK